MNKPTIRKYADHALLLPVCGHTAIVDKPTEASITRLRNEVKAFSDLRKDSFLAAADRESQLDITFDSKSFEYKSRCKPIFLRSDSTRYSCRLPYLCPWCFVKYKLVPALDAILDYSKHLTLRQRSTAAYVGYHAITDNFDLEKGKVTLHPSFDKRYGYHQQLNCYMAKHFCFPIVQPVNEVNRLVSGNFGITLYDTSVDYNLAAKSRFKGISVRTHVTDLSKQSLYALAARTFYKLDWKAIYDVNDSTILMQLYALRNAKHQCVRTYSREITYDEEGTV